MISKIDGALEKISSSEHDLTRNCGKWSQKQIFKWKVDNGWPKDTAWFPFICLLATVYFRPLSIWCLKNFLSGIIIFRKKIVFFFHKKKNPRSLPFPHFPLYAALEHSVPTCCGKNQYSKSFLWKKPYKWAICTLTFTLLKQLSTNKQFVDTQDSPSLAEA